VKDETIAQDSSLTKKQHLRSTLKESQTLEELKKALAQSTQFTEQLKSLNATQRAGKKFNNGTQTTSPSTMDVQARRTLVER